MKSSDLMIGDYVLAHREECVADGGQYMSWNEYGKVARIYEDAVELSFLAREDDSEEIEVKNITAIPVTIEILEKNGFEKILDEDNIECYRYYTSSADGYIKITLWGGLDADWSLEIINYDKFNDNKIVYKNIFMFLKLHELEHALRLCEIKKEIVL